MTPLNGDQQKGKPNMKYWLIQIATNDEDMDAVQERLDTLWETGGDEVLASKVQGVAHLATTDHRLIAGDKIPGEEVRHGKFTAGTVGSLIEGLKAVDPTGEREVKNVYGAAFTHVFLDENGVVYISTATSPANGSRRRS